MSILRDGSPFSWYVIPIFAFVVYVYANEIERRNWNLVLAGLAFWGMDWFNEIWNTSAPWLIIVFGYLTFFLVSYWVFDMKTMRSKLMTVGAIWAVDAAAILLFGVGLGWL